jgi:hypothetical protein
VIARQRYPVTIGVILISAAFVLLQCWEYIFPLGRGWIYDYGAGLETIPTHLALVRQQALGSLWAAFVAGGVDRLSFFGNADSPWLLDTWLFLAFSPATASGLHMFLQIWLGAVFTGIYCHSKLRLNFALTVFSALIYAAFSYPVFGHLFNSAVIPLLACILTSPRNRKWPILLLSGLLTSLVTSLSQGFPFIVLFLALWAVLVERLSIRTAVVTLVSFSVGYLLLKLPTLLAILASASSSQRSGEFRYDSLIDTSVLYTESDFLYSDVHMWTYAQITSGFFLAIVAALLLMHFIRRAHPSEHNAYPVAAVAGMLVVYVILASGIAVPVRDALTPVLPWLGSFNMVRTITTAGAFLNSVLTTAGIALLSQIFGQAQFRRNLIAVLVALLFTATISPRYIARGEMLALVGLYCTALILAWLASRRGVTAAHGADAPRNRRIDLAIIAPCMIALIAYGILWPKASLGAFRQSPDTGYNLYHMPAVAEIERNDRSAHRFASVLPLQPAYALSNGVETIDGWANLYSSQFRNYWLAILDPLFKVRPQERAIFGADGGRPQDHYIFLGTGAFLPDDKPGGMNIDLRFNMSLLSLMNVGYLLSFYPLDSQYLQPVYTPANPHAAGELWGAANGRAAKLSAANANLDFWTSLLGGAKAFVERRPDAPDRVYAYKNLCALPRVFAVDSIQIHNSEPEVLQSLSNASPDELLHRGHVVATNSPDLSAQLARPIIRLLKYRSDRLSFTATADGDSFVVVGNTWAPGWKAYVDDAEVSLTKVNYIQMGIGLKGAGTHRVELVYAPPYGRFHVIPLPSFFNYAAPVPPMELNPTPLPAVCSSTSPRLSDR